MDASPEDQLLWQRLRKGNEDAFRSVFDRHHKAVYNFAFRHTASWAVAEEATQAAFTTVWRRARDGSLPGLAGGSSRAWLLGVVRNECRNLARSGVRQTRVALKTASPSGSEDNVAAWLDGETSMRRINEVLSRVPDKQRHVLELLWSGLGLTEVAAALHIPLGTAKSRLSRARQTLATSEVAHLLEGE